MINLETWISLGSLLMAIMFIALIISFYSFLVGPDGKGPGIYVDPQGVLIQIISISGVPSLILAGTVFGFQKKYETMHAGANIDCSRYYTDCWYVHCYDDIAKNQCNLHNCRNGSNSIYFRYRGHRCSLLWMLLT